MFEILRLLEVEPEPEDVEAVLEVVGRIRNFSIFIFLENKIT